MVVRIAKRYQRHGLNFCIITFYDPQRAAIAKALEAVDLPTGCVYNVDSFQGIDHPSNISNGGALISTMVGTVRKRSRLCDLVFSQDRTSRILELAASHERRSDPLSERNGSRHGQAFPAGGGKKYAPRAALPCLGTAPRHLDRLERHAGRFRCAPGTTNITTVQLQQPTRAGIYICIYISTAYSPYRQHQHRQTTEPRPKL